MTRQQEISPGVSIIVPVYRGYIQTKKCLNSVRRSFNNNVDVLIVNDCSPEPEVQELCGQYALLESFDLIQHSENKGFVRSVNEAMKRARCRDVILLNSDAEVSGDWICRLQKAAYSGDAIASVTPFSNNATICSYPIKDGDNVLLSGVDLSSMQDICSKAARCERVELPTGIGFCMYIRRDCLDDVGYFDEEAFGKGYGEENDFCLRASQKGWKHLLASDCFVYHEGGVSFNEQKQALVANAEKVIAERYPSYFDDVKKFNQQDPIRPFRDRIDAEIFRRGGEAAAALWALRAQEYHSRSN